MRCCTLAGWGRVTAEDRGRTVNLSGRSSGAAIEAGMPFALGWQGLVVEPQTQVIYQRLDFRNRTDVDGIDGTWVSRTAPPRGSARG